MRKFNYKRLIVMLVVVLAMTCLMATTAFAAGTGMWPAPSRAPGPPHPPRSSRWSTNVVFPAIDLILAVFFFAKLAPPTSSTENPASSSGRLPPSCLPASCLPSLRPCISGALSASKEGI